MDDGLCGGNQYFHEMIKRLEAKFPFGSRKTQSFVFTGIEMHQQNDYSIVMSQEKYVSKINPIHIHNEKYKKTFQSQRERETGLKSTDRITPVCIREHETRPVKPLKFSAERSEQSDRGDSHPGKQNSS